MFMYNFFIFFQRRAGIRDGGNARHVNLPMAWTELAQLAQCRGKIQEGIYICIDNLFFCNSDKLIHPLIRLYLFFMCYNDTYNIVSHLNVIVRSTLKKLL